MIEVRFMSLVGKFATERTTRFATYTEAFAAIRAHAEAGGFRNVKLVDDSEEQDAMRFTATTPGGRGGRNVAFADECGDEVGE